MRYRENETYNNFELKMCKIAQFILIKTVQILKLLYGIRLGQFSCFALQAYDYYVTSKNNLQLII